MPDDKKETNDGQYFPAQPTDPDFEEKRKEMLERLKAPIGKAHSEEPNPFAEEAPLLVFEQDLDEGIRLGQEMAKNGYAQMPDGFWTMTPNHMATIIERAKQFRHSLLNDNLGISWGTQDQLLRALKTITSLLPGGDQ